MFKNKAIEITSIPKLQKCVIMFGKGYVRTLVNENIALLAILIGFLLIAISMGPFQTLDTELEFDTTRSILRVGWPILPSTGEILNEPPLGFYTAACFFKVFGFTMVNGANLVAFFGVGCAFAVYLIGKEFYGKLSGLFSAAFFVLAPWELYLSRAFLIDAQCLFLSLVCLYFGVKAILRDSSKLALVSGVFFAAALLTKLYAAFMLVPLLLLFLYRRPKKPKLVLSQLVAFSVPAVYANLLWYQIFLREDLFAYVFFHNDFRDVNFPWVVPSYAFIGNFLVNFGIGLFFVVSVVFSLSMGLLFRKHFPKNFLVFDLVCLVSLLSVLGVNMYLGVNLDLKAPYTSAVKFSYQSLPFFSLLAGSLAAKSVALLSNAVKCVKLKKFLVVSMAIVGVFFLFAPLIVNMNSANRLSTTSYIVFQVQPGQDLGYSFYVDQPISSDSLLMVGQFLGFLLIFLGLFWASRGSVNALFKRVPLFVQSRSA